MHAPPSDIEKRARKMLRSSGSEKQRLSLKFHFFFLSHRAFICAPGDWIIGISREVTIPVPRSRLVPKKIILHSFSQKILSSHQSPCCGKIYSCRFCHDDAETHTFNRKQLVELICTECDTRQKVQVNCEKCGTRFGKYTCLICNLFDDDDKNQYHCESCGICRVGGKDRFFHCSVCNMCLPMQLKTEGR